MAEGRQYMVDAPWIITSPGAALMITVLGLNLLGDGLRDVLDPRLRCSSDGGSPFPHSRAGRGRAG